MNAYYSLMIFHVCLYQSFYIQNDLYIYIHICIYVFFICIYLHGGMYLYLYVLWTANCIVAMHRDYVHTKLMVFFAGIVGTMLFQQKWWCHSLHFLMLRNLGSVFVCVCVNIPDIETIYYLQNVIYHTWLNILWSHPDVLYNLKDLTGVQWATGC